MGMQTMDQNLRDRYVDRLISLEVAMAHAGNVGNLQRLISAAAASGAKSSAEIAERETPSLEGTSMGV